MMPDLSSEFVFKTSRSSGAGGQHVNKVSTRVELIFNIEQSGILSEEQKETIKKMLADRVRKDGAIHLVSSRERSQPANKKEVIRRFYTLISSALKPVKKRKKTQLPQAVLLHHKEQKKLLSLKKQARRGKVV